MVDEPNEESVELLADIVIRAVKVERKHSLGDGILKLIPVLDWLCFDRSKLRFVSKNRVRRPH